MGLPLSGRVCCCFEPKFAPVQATGPVEVCLACKLVGKVLAAGVSFSI